MVSGRLAEIEARWAKMGDGVCYWYHKQTPVETAWAIMHAPGDIAWLIAEVRRKEESDMGRGYWLLLSALVFGAIGALLVSAADAATAAGIVTLMVAGALAAVAGVHLAKDKDIP